MVLADLRRCCLRVGPWEVVVLASIATAQDRGQAVRAALMADGTMPAYHALLIGINEYQHWQDLRRPRKDAEALAAVLKNDYGFGDVRLLLDQDATQKGILRHLESCLSLGRGDSLLVFFAGHGGFHNGLDDGFWVPCDAERNSTSDYILNSAVQKFVSKMKARHVLVVSDSCFSGAMLRGETPTLPATLDTEWYRRTVAKPSRFAICSGDLETVPDDSVFAVKFLNKLQFPTDSAIGAKEIALALEKEVPLLSKQTVLSARIRNDPNDENGQFVFVRVRMTVKPPDPGVVAPPAVVSTSPQVPSGPVAVALTGGLTVKSPLAGTVTLDGAGSHAIRPDRALTWNAVGVGLHVVQVACASGTWRRTVEVKEGETLTVSAEFAPPEPPARRAGEEVTMNLGGGVTMTMVWIPPGSFTMGSPTGEAGRDNDETQHRVTLTKGFWMGKYEVTQRQWQQIMGNSPSHFTGAGLDAPVERVSWDDCQEFVGKVNARVSGGGFRLPTEAEWEYACRAGTTTALHNGRELTSTGGKCANLDEVAWYDENSGRKTHPAGQKRVNAWGLYDMHGNVWEWCQDWYGDYPSGSVTDPAGPGSGSCRVNRGGGWGFNARLCRSANRDRNVPGSRIYVLGCRLVRTGSSFPER